MRGEFVEERDSSWERDDPRFRVYVFDGPDNAVTTLDILDATVEEALESALALSSGNDRLWALALVDDGARGTRGLVWLSGMDYSSTPATSREWRRRRQMQDRYLSERHRRGLPPRLPNGLRVIRLFPEWVSGWPLWESFTDEYHLRADDLGVSSALGKELYAWNEAWQARDEEAPVPRGWREQGRDLCRRLQQELDGVAEVRPEFM